MCCVGLTVTCPSSDEQDGVVTSSLMPKRYKFIHVPRAGRGGGVAVLCKEQYSMRAIPSFKEERAVHISIV